MHRFLSSLCPFQLAFLLTLFLGSPVRAELLEYRTVPEKSSLSITGTSTLHDWQITASFEKSSLLLDRIQNESGPDIAGATVTVPVRAMRSGKAGMDKNTYKALKADLFPVITFHTGDRVSAREGSRNTGWGYIVSGHLSVMERNTPLSVPLLLEQTPDGGFFISGKTDFLMSDLGVPPPRAALGAIRTGDRVTVTFEWVLQPTGPLPEAGRQ